jgi:hypothetical protein
MEKIVIRGLTIPRKTVEKIIRFVTPRNTKLPPIVIEPTHGKYIIDGVYYANDKELFLKVSKKKDFPMKMTVTPKEKRKGYLEGFILKDKKEALVYLAGHEIRHRWQAQYPNAKRMGRRKNKYSESDADIYAVQKLNEWRKRKKSLIAKSSRGRT